MLIRKTALGNPTWGPQRIRGGLLKLGIENGKTSASQYLPRRRKPPPQTWRTFLGNHGKDIVSIDLFTVPTATIRVLFVFLVLSNDRRKILHFNVTDSPKAAWTGQQLREVLLLLGFSRSSTRGRTGKQGRAETSTPLAHPQTALP